MLRKSWHGLVLCLFALTVPNSASAQEELPPNQSVRISIHVDPEDSESPIQFVVTMSLSAQSKVESEIAWSVDSVRIEQYASNGDQIDAWYEFAPAVSTGDGYWRINHANPLSPDISEFSVPPEVTGFAESEFTSGDYLDYRVLGKIANSNVEKPYGSTFFADYSFWKLSDSEPLDEGEDKPVEGDEGGDGLG